MLELDDNKEIIQASEKEIKACDDIITDICEKGISFAREKHTEALKYLSSKFNRNYIEMCAVYTAVRYYELQPTHTKTCNEKGCQEDCTYHRHGYRNGC